MKELGLLRDSENILTGRGLLQETGERDASSGFGGPC